MNTGLFTWLFMLSFVLFIYFFSPNILILNSKACCDNQVAQNSVEKSEPLDPKTESIDSLTAPTDSLDSVSESVDQASEQVQEVTVPTKQLDSVSESADQASESLPTVSEGQETAEELQEGIQKPWELGKPKVEQLGNDPVKGEPKEPNEE